MWKSLRFEFFTANPYSRKTCNESGRAFDKSCDLKVHAPIHSGATPFKCAEHHEGFGELFAVEEACIENTRDKAQTSHPSSTKEEVPKTP